MPKQTIYFLCQYVLNFQFERQRAMRSSDTQRVFKIITDLTGPEIPTHSLPHGEYFVMKVERKFDVVAHPHETTYTREEVAL